MGCGGVIAFFLVLFVALVECNSRGSNFRQCCAQGKEASTYGSGSCTDFSRLNDKSTSCKFAYTICCSQNKRTSECEKGKRHALAGHRCDDLQGRSDCDSLTDCCNCCELGIQTKKSGDQCNPPVELNAECNAVFMECCKQHQPTPSCSSHSCSNNQYCEDARTGPVCRCPNGYERDTLTNHCIDVDECKRPSVCSSGSTCQNSVGSFQCTRSCGVGYTFDAIFVQCRDVNECMTSAHNCNTGMRCENYPGSFRCIREKPCGTGYSVNVYTQECDDIDECSLSLHDCQRGFLCLNVIGTFKCKAKECQFGYVFNYNLGDCEKIICKRGYEIDQSGKCVDINECAQNICHYNEKCENTPGSYKCILQLICGEGYELNAQKTECVDIDECAIGRHTCPTMATCVNTPKSYKCVCPNGYKLDVTRNICEDIDECALGKVCPSNSYCKNTPGSFTCECKAGFNLVSHIFYSCVDIDECENPNICDHKCVNTFGSYQCVCNEGYRLDSDKRTCVDIDECAVQPSICPGGCRNTPGSYECTCGAGFQLDVRFGRTCEDIDECEMRTHTCGATDTCVNTRGHFQCIKIDCPAGYNLVAEVKSSRCDRAPVVCKYGEMECLRKPMKIFYSYTSVSHMMQVPMRIFTTRVNTYSRRIKVKGDFKVVDSSGAHLREDQFMVKQTDPTTFDIYLLEQCKTAEKFSLELKIEFYNEVQFQSCLLNKIYLFIV